MAKTLDTDFTDLHRLISDISRNSRQKKVSSQSLKSKILNPFNPRPNLYKNDKLHYIQKRKQRSVGDFCPRSWR